MGTMLSHSPLRLLTTISVAALLFGCSPPQEPSDFAKKHRVNLVKETAAAYASQYALHWEAGYINNHLERYSRTMDGIFDFRSLLLPNGVVPPVLEDSYANVSQDSAKHLRMSDRMIKIVASSRFSTTAPTWRDYLVLAFPKPETPHEKLLPTTTEERKAWDAGLIEGWSAGRWQINSIFQVNLGMLQRDFTGMILYYKMLNQGMISPTYSAVANLGVTGDGRSMQLNDRVVKITTESALQPNRVDQWQAAVPLVGKDDN